MVPLISHLNITSDPVAGEKVDVELDARHLRCPMPLLKAKQAINSMQAGQILRVMATDPGSVRDFQAWSAQSGNVLVSLFEQDATFIYVLRKHS